VARPLGVRRNTSGRWLALYAAGGLAALLPTSVPAGKPVALAPEVLASLAPALRRPDGFASDEALRQWVVRTHGVQVKYQTLYPLGRTRFKATLKVARPQATVSRTPRGGARTVCSRAAVTSCGRCCLRGLSLAAMAVRVCSICQRSSAVRASISQPPFGHRDLLEKVPV
jgi:hypothetical protein